MSARIVVTALAALAGIVLLASCGEEEIVLARLPTRSDGGSAVEPKRCFDVGDCPSDALCLRSECRDDGGICTARPTQCEEEGLPVCGCDGVTYWNDCLRRAARITAASAGPCAPEVAETCDDRRGPGSGPPGARCPAGTFCARLLPRAREGAPTSCPPEVPGTCWAAVPLVCPSDSGPERWTRCADPDAVCLTTCDAIRSGKPHRLAKACP